MIRQLFKFKITCDRCKAEKTGEFDSEHVGQSAFDWPAPIDERGRYGKTLCPECHLKALLDAADKAAKDFADAAMKSQAKTE